MYRKKFFAILTAGIFLFNSSAFAEETEEDFPAVDAPFSNSKTAEDNNYEEQFPAVDRPFSRNSHSKTINHTDERGQEKISETEVFAETPPETPPEIPPETPPAENPPEQAEGDGLEFLFYNENGVQAFAVIAAHEQYNLRPILAKHQIKGRSTVMQMAGELNDIATINAGYFSADGALIGITKLNGLIVSADYFNRSAIGINSDETVIFGRVKYSGRITLHGESIEIRGVNCERVANSLVIYNDIFSTSTGTNDHGIEIIEYGGVITDIKRGKGDNLIPSHGHVISAHGNSAEFFADAQIGDEILIEENIESEDADFNSAIYVLGAGPRLVKDGRIFVTAQEEKFPADISVGRAPRSAVGITKYGDFIFAVVDGRQSHSHGCTLEEWADILLNKFGAYQAINLDGGGSAELVVKDKLVNSPSDGRERAVGSSLTILPK